jgi:hypothetical protein
VFVVSFFSILFWCLCYNKLVSEPRFIWLEIICQGTSTVHRRCCLEAIDRVSFIGGEHDSPEHCSSAQLLFIYSTVHGRRILFIKALFTKSTVHKQSTGCCSRNGAWGAVHGTEHGVLFTNGARGAIHGMEHGVLFTNGARSAVHEQSTGCCSRNGAWGAVHGMEHGMLFTNGARGVIHGMEHGVLFTDRAQSVVHGQSTSDDSVPFKIREGKFCQPAKLMPKETGF